MPDAPEEHSLSPYDYSDKSVPQAGYAAIAYGVIAVLNGVLAWIQYFIYHRPGGGGAVDHEFANQQWLAHTPLITAVAIVISLVIAAVSTVLAFGIFRRSRAAIVTMIIFVIVLQVYTWIIARSIAGTLLSIVVVAFLLRGAKRMFQDHAERAATA